MWRVSYNGVMDRHPLTVGKMRRDIMERCAADAENHFIIGNENKDGNNDFGKECDGDGCAIQDRYIRSKRKRHVHLPESNACTIAVVEKINASNIAEMESLEEKLQEFRIQREKDEVLKEMQRRRTELRSSQRALGKKEKCLRPTVTLTD